LPKLSNNLLKISPKISVKKYNKTPIFGLPYSKKLNQSDPISMCISTFWPSHPKHSKKFINKKKSMENQNQTTKLF